MIAYFGRDERGYYYDALAENGNTCRIYCDERTWRMVIEAGAHAGADITGVDEPNGARVKLKVTEQVSVRKFDAASGQLTEETLGAPETSVLQID